MHLALKRINVAMHEVQVSTVVSQVRQLVLQISQLPVTVSPTVLPNGHDCEQVLFQKKYVSKQVRQKLRLVQV